jgi:hypothetical protein
LAALQTGLEALALLRMLVFPLLLLGDRASGGDSCFIVMERTS